MTVSNFIKITEQGLLDGNSPHSLVAKEVITLTRQGFDYCLTVMPIFFRGVRCDAVFSPSFSPYLMHLLLASHLKSLAPHLIMRSLRLVE